MSYEKLRPAFTFTEDRLKEFQAVVPEAFADGKINWDVLREALGEYLEEENQEHFGLFWPGKREARKITSTASTRALFPVTENDLTLNTGNIYIDGENLEVLKLLQKSYSNRIKLIYIDPPYNTGRDFIYYDKFAEARTDYLQKTGDLNAEGIPLTTNTRASGRYHSNWLSMMYPRLRLAKTLLNDLGTIFVSIDDNEVHNLRQLMNEIFGEENFIATVIWQKNFSPKNTAKHFSEDHDYIVIYAKNAELWRPNLLERSEEALARYVNPDNDLRGDWSSSDLTARNYYGEGKYEVVSPGGKTFRPSIGSYWRIAYKKFQALDKDNRIWWGEDGNNMPRLKRFLSEVKGGVVPQTLWFYEDVGHTQEAKRDLLAHVSFEYTENVLNTVKPVRLLRRIIDLATDAISNDIVLDFFSGSASTAHAVLVQNNEDKGNRRFIMVQFPEPLPKAETKLKTISDIGIARIKKVIYELENKLVNGSVEQDLGIKLIKVGGSSFKHWQEYQGKDVAEIHTLFDMFESPLVDGWKAQDLITEVLLLQGFPLDSIIRQHPTFSNNTVFHVHSEFCDHDLYICLDARMEKSTIDKVELYFHDIFVCLDTALTDEAKIQLADRCNLKVI